MSGNAQGVLIKARLGSYLDYQKRQAQVLPMFRTSLATARFLRGRKETANVETVLPKLTPIEAVNFPGQTYPGLSSMGDPGPSKMKFTASMIAKERADPTISVQNERRGQRKSRLMGGPDNRLFKDDEVDPVTGAVRRSALLARGLEDEPLGPQLLAGVPVAPGEIGHRRISTKPNFGSAGAKLSPFTSSGTRSLIQPQVRDRLNTHPFNLGRRARSGLT